MREKLLKIKIGKFQNSAGQPRPLDSLSIIVGIRNIFFIIIPNGLEIL